ncbi:MAG TPA: Hsp20/alpha crystallin family protein [Pirellulales bacterium]|jgi:HSP20 family molecular chaperone IbpA
MTSEATVEKDVQNQQGCRTRGPESRVFRPSVDILELADELLIFANVPGAVANQIDVQFEGGQLTVRAPVAARQTGETNYLLREYGVGEFLRTFRVGEQIDGSRITAEYTDGVLKLHLPKAEAAKQRKIEVKG